MSKPKALTLADELCESMPGYPEPTTLERAAADMLRQQHAALQEWSDKTAWVQATLAPKELGMHYADIPRSRVNARDTRIAELEAELVAEAKKTASEKLRADQMTEQHRMQAKMHKAAAEALGKVLSAVQRYLPPDGPSDGETLNEIIGIVDPWPIPLDSSEPKPASTPWYPDDSGEWVEVPEDLAEMPAELSSETMIEGLTRYEREEQVYIRSQAKTRYWVWNAFPHFDDRIVAYKVVKP